MPGSLGLSHQVMNSLHQRRAAKVSAEEERGGEEPGQALLRPAAFALPGPFLVQREKQRRKK